jgi:hypothetical protein
MSKAVIATFTCQEAFRIPKGVDLEDTTVVKSWGVKRDTLYIDFVDGRELQIYGEDWVSNFSFKWPDDERIVDAADYGIEDEEEEEQSEYMNEIIECFKCECSVKRIDMAWRDYGYLDVCQKCDDENNKEQYSCDKCKIRDAGAWSQNDKNNRSWDFCDICMFEYDKLIDEGKTTFEKWTAEL